MISFSQGVMEKLAEVLDPDILGQPGNPFYDVTSGIGRTAGNIFAGPGRAIAGMGDAMSSMPAVAGTGLGVGALAGLAAFLAKKAKTKLAPYGGLFEIK